MIHIRKEQMEVLEAVMLEQFIADTVKHVRGLFPEITGEMQETEIREKIENGRSKAATYGLSRVRPITLYIDLVFAYGNDFEKGKELRWSEPILQDESIPEEAKMDLIYKRLGQIESW